MLNILQSVKLTDGCKEEGRSTLMKIEQKNFNAISNRQLDFNFKTKKILFYIV